MSEAKPAGITLNEKHFPILAQVLALLSLVHLALALGTRNGDIFRLLPAWPILLALLLSSSWMRSSRFALWALTLSLCLGSEFLYFGSFHNEILFRAAVCYVPFSIFLLVLHSARCQEEQQNLDRAELELKSLRADAEVRLKALQKLQSGELEEEKEDQHDQLQQKNQVFEIYRAYLPRVLDLRYKREIPPLIREVATQGFGIEAGVIFEIPAQKTGEVQVRSHWGFDAPEGPEALLAPFGKGELVRETADTKNPLEPEAIQRKPVLFEEFDKFSETVFAPVQLAPLMVLGRTNYVVILGRPSSRGRAPWTPQSLHPLLEGAGLAISKLAQKDGRARVQSF